MIRYVVVQRVSDGRLRVSSLILLDLVDAMRIQSRTSKLFPQLRFEIAVATRAMRRQIDAAGGSIMTYQPPPKTTHLMWPNDVD